VPQQDLEPEPQRPLLESHGCYVWGSVGTGKSLLLDLFAECCERPLVPSLRCRRVHFHKFMYEVHRQLHQLRQTGAIKKTTQAVASQIAEEVNVLAFDEFQITNISDALIVETLFDALFQEGVAILMTSNRHPEDLYKDGLNRHLAIPQFLGCLERRGVQILELGGGRDFRKELAAAAWNFDAGWRDFFHKAAVGGDAAAESLLQSAFAKAAGGSMGHRTSVPVAWGRTLEVDEAVSGVGRFSFQQLCGDALNADDYLRLAATFHTIVVANVPRFSVSLHNEARRFTNLVDCAYETHSRLILSADAPPAELLQDMTVMAESLVQASDHHPAKPGPSRAIRTSPFTLDASEIQEVSRSSRSIGARAVRAGDDDTATGAGVAGVMAGALGSLQESGFAAQRATSRLLHMQTEEYLRAHFRNRVE